MFLKLLRSSALISVILVMTSFGMPGRIVQDPCSRVNAQISISKDHNQVVTAKAVATGAKAPVRYIFSNAKGEIIPTDFKSAEVKNLSAGKYTCLIREAGGCRKLLEFEVK